MAYTIRGRRVAYDNIISTAKNIGKERTILGNAGSTEKYGAGGNVSIGSTEPTSDSTPAREHMIPVSGTGKTTLWPAECMVSTQ